METYQIQVRHKMYSCFKIFKIFFRIYVVVSSLNSGRTWQICNNYRKLRVTNYNLYQFIIITHPVSSQAGLGPSLTSFTKSTEDNLLVMKLCISGIGQTWTWTFTCTIFVLFLLFWGLDWTSLLGPLPCYTMIMYVYVDFWS